jgi:hypothetical protein
MPEPRVENPEHDSLVLKFNQIEHLIERATTAADDGDVDRLCKAVDDLGVAIKSLRPLVIR